MQQKSYAKELSVLFFVLTFLFFINITLGSVSIAIDEIIKVLLGGESSKPSWDLIILQFRVPKAISAMLVGSGLSISGLLMQTLFRNPLAGPLGAWKHNLSQVMYLLVCALYLIAQSPGSGGVCSSSSKARSCYFGIA